MLGRYFPLAFALALLGTGSQAATAPLRGNFSGALKILQLNFNSEDVLADSSGTLRGMRHQSIIDWVHANDPDMIFIEEGWNYQSDPSIAVTMGRELGYDVAYRLDIGVPGIEYDSDAILAKKKFAMSDEQDVELPHSAPSLGDGKTWVLAFGAVSYGVGVKLHLENGETLYTYVTHLLGDTPQDRADQLQTVSQNLEQTLAADGKTLADAQVVIGGDFNSTPDEPSIQSLLNQGFADTWATMHPNDPGYTDCSDPAQPYFNPVTIGPGLFPAQYNEDADQRLDYVFVHSPVMTPLAATQIFTVPYENAWMSDHYGVQAVIGANPGYAIPNPARDFEGTVPDTVITRLKDEDFLCTDPWNQDDPGCRIELPDITVTGPRGATFIDQSNFHIWIQAEGPGLIFTSNEADFDSGQQAAFNFVGDGDYHYTISNIVEAPNPYRAKLHGTIHVNASGSPLIQ